MLGITHDTADDLRDVALDRSNHLIRPPKQVAVEETAGGLASVAVTDGNGATHVVRLKEPLTLPPAASPGRA